MYEKNSNIFFTCPHQHFYQNRSFSPVKCPYTPSCEITKSWERYHISPSKKCNLQKSIFGGVPRAAIRNQRNHECIGKPLSTPTTRAVISDSIRSTQFIRFDPRKACYSHGIGKTKKSCTKNTRKKKSLQQPRHSRLFLRTT